MPKDVLKSGLMGPALEGDVSPSNPHTLPQPSIWIWRSLLMIATEMLQYIAQSGMCSSSKGGILTSISFFKSFRLGPLFWRPDLTPMASLSNLVPPLPIAGAACHSPCLCCSTAKFYFTSHWKEGVKCLDRPFPMVMMASYNFDQSAEK